MFLSSEQFQLFLYGPGLFHKKWMNNKLSLIVIIILGGATWIAGGIYIDRWYQKRYARYFEWKKELERTFL
ncbi:hypothetical protein [Aquibacillus kalidii]|uniref:hypothetical protein n=1 Tax=Aquibacillus kalidii TaxID=2762597 RepID=UPI0016474BE6|nr:hypothetical protein [Aquibacillus kalidii]